MYYIVDPKLKEKIKVLREKRRLFHLMVTSRVLGFFYYKIIQGRHSDMYGKISSTLYGDCTFVSGNMTLKWGDCTDLVGDFTGLPPGNVREMEPKLIVISRKPDPRFVNDDPDKRN